ncbi:hypothetical protein GCM10010517_04110 [Streptosporangium fragile]|uniref:DUF4190 domain-containing protein n=1 Tax=Streptosporangium fragile TaxID=46186 RepID=A0ABN3VQB3_9ACTN
MSYDNQPGGYQQPPGGGGYGSPGGYGSSGGYGSPGGYGPPPGGHDPYGGYGPPPGGHDPYGGYGGPPPPPPPQRNNGMAVAALILGIAGLFFCGLPSVVGVVLGHVSLGQIKRTGEDGRPMALTGLVLSYVGVALWLILVLGWAVTFGVIFDSALNPDPDYGYDIPEVHEDPEVFDLPTTEATAPGL